jgi:hypothetical protein
MMNVWIHVSQFVGPFAAAFIRGRDSASRDLAQIRKTTHELAFGPPVERTWPHPTADEIREAVRRDGPWQRRVDLQAVRARLREIYERTR